MMHVLPCDRVREDLAAYHDGELAMDARVLVQSHLQECVTCRLEEQALSDLGDALRTMATSVPGRAEHDGRLSAAVLERVHVEHQLSLGARVRDLFEDMHFVWAGLGASLAMLFCIFASAGVLQAASQEKPGSLAGIISALASADDPVRLAGAVIENRALLDTTEAMQTTDEDAELMLSALVTRDGRIQNLELLEKQARALHIKPETIGAMLEAASRARFEPAQSGGLPVAVNVVWLVTSTTVKGQPDYDLYLLRPPRWNPTVVMGPGLPAKRPVASVKPAVVGDADGLAA
jgi:hypothetical protein